MHNLQNIFHLKADTDFRLAKSREGDYFFVWSYDEENGHSIIENIKNASQVVSNNGILTPKHIEDSYLGSIYQNINFQTDIPNNYLNQLCEVLKKLYSIKTKKFGPFDPNLKLTGTHGRWESYLLLNLGTHLDYLFDNQLISDNDNYNIFSKILSFCHEFPFTDTPSLLHGDLGPQNIKFYQDKLYLIDWDDALSGDPLYDLANWATFAWHSKNDEKYIFEFIKKFDYKFPDFIFWIYFLRISVMKMVILHKQGYKDLSRAKNRINRALYE